ncbi:MAG: CPBP family intramembrane glutamic endopeptidase, partial [Microthrixaceae bacterium]
LALTQGNSEYATFPDTESLLRAMTVPIGVSVLFVIAVVSVLRWWPRIVHDDHPVRSWVWVVPALMIAGAALGTDYENLGNIPSSLLVALAGSSLLVGIGEELMFRGVTVQTLRGHGMSETRVGLWSSLIFGGVHITNIITEGPQAFVQVILVAASGYFLYLTYRVSGTIVVPILVHASWDFALFSHNAGNPDPQVYSRQFLPTLSLIVIVIVLVVRRHKIEPEQIAASGTSPDV